MKILVTGANGQLGYEIKREVLSSRFIVEGAIKFVDVEDFDITDKSALENHIKDFCPDVVINAAAYTAVDKSETERDMAFVVNSMAVEYLSELSNRYQFFLLHISTDYVFDGKSHLPITEDHPMAPESHYGISKASGEVQMRRICRHGVIIRTSWLYSCPFSNFPNTILKQAKEKGEIKVVNDQIGSPTYAADLAQFILNHLKMMLKVKGVETYHFSNSGVATWYDFAHSIVEIAAIECQVIPVSTAEYPSVAPRPVYSVLCKKKINKHFKYIPRHWREALKEYLKDVVIKQ